MTAYLASKEVRLQNYIKLIVHDGIGFDMDSFEPEDGLKNMRERRKIIGSTFTALLCQTRKRLSQQQCPEKLNF